MIEAGRAFAAWSDFYVIVGSSAAALTGLQFVVMVLSADIGLGSPSTTRAFATPTVVHFCAVLLVSAVMASPLAPVAVVVILAACGGAGAIYVVTTALQARAQQDYRPVFEDWLWHVALPLAAYIGAVAAAALLRRQPAPGADIVAGTTLLLLFTGIHNAWDSVVFLAQRAKERPPQ